VEDLNEAGPVKIASSEWLPAEVFQTMSEADYEATFVEYVAEKKAEAVDRARQFLAKYDCVDRFNRLHTLLMNDRLLPFVGAGLSIPSGFPGWRQFLVGLTIEYPSTEAAVTALLDESRFEEAAQALLDRMGPVVFSEAIQNKFGTRQRPILGPVRLLPELFGRGCITTNFDYVLDQVFDQSPRPFVDTFGGAKLMEAPRRLAETYHCLLRLHGEADSEEGRVLTSAEYDRQYERGQYPELLKVLIGNAGLLFLGCSLSVDRTIQALRDAKVGGAVQTPRHYAFLPMNDNVDREARRDELGHADIHPIWYPADDHDQAIEDLLIALMEGGFHA
jgi:hypothetical protein